LSWERKFHEERVGLANIPTSRKLGVRTTRNLFDGGETVREGSGRADEAAAEDEGRIAIYVSDRGLGILKTRFFLELGVLAVTTDSLPHHAPVVNWNNDGVLC